MDSEVAETCYRIFPCFLVLEDSKNRPVYVTEVQYEHCSLLKFKELNGLQLSDTSLGLRVIGKYPSQTNNEELRNQWVQLQHYKPVLKTLTWLGDNLDLQYSTKYGQLECITYNIPIFEFKDGFYTLPEHSSVFVRGSEKAMPHNPVKKSMSFNSMLKLNKIIQYLSQVQHETQGFGNYIESNYTLEDKEHVHIKQSIKKYRERIRKSKESIDSLNSEISGIELTPELEPTSGQRSTTLESSGINDDYGSEFSTFAQNKNKLKSLQIKKLSQMISIIEHLHMNDFISTEEAKVRNDPFYTDFRRVSLAQVTTAVDKNQLNAKLGYYLLLMKVIADHILFIPLPHTLSFKGSNSLIDNWLPFYTIQKSNQQHENNLQKALSSFNKNVNQLRQYMEHHREPVSDDQTSFRESR